MAASYSMNDGFDLNARLDLTEDGRFQFRWAGCLGLIAEATGRYAAEESVVRFTPESGEFERSPRTFDDVMHRVRWGDREYLLPESRMLAFANAVNVGSEPRSGPMGDFYLRSGDDKRSVQGQPSLVAGWSEFLLTSPVVGNVVVVEQGETATQRPIVVLDAGGNVGLREGMELLARNPRRPNFKAYLTVLSVEPESARAVVDLQYAHIRSCDVWRSRLPSDGTAQADAADEAILSSCLAERAPSS